jgi:hypothetical protein
MHDVDPLSFIINEICLSPFTFNPQHAFRKVFNQGTLVDEPYRKFLELSVNWNIQKMISSLPSIYSTQTQLIP